MIRDCIDPKEAKALKALINGGDISVDDLKAMPSKDRTALFAKHIDKDLAIKLNVGFEKRINSETKGILEKYIERELTAVPKKIKTNVTEKLLKIKNVLDPAEGEPFLDELVAHKIGAYLEPETAQRMLKFAEKAQTLRADITKVTEKIAGGNADKLKELESLKIQYGARGNIKPVKGQNIDDLNELSEARLAYGRADYDVKHYMEAVVKQKQKGVPTPDGVLPKAAFYGVKAFTTTASVTKALKATLDNSVFGRQGWKLMLMNNEAWRNNFVKSWVDIAKSFGDLKADRTMIDAAGEPTEFFYENVMREAHAEIVSRPNSLRGAYRMATNEYGLGVTAEELFPHLADYTKGDYREKIFGNAVVNPVVRLHKGFENAFGAGALRMRADFADALIAKVELTQGVSAMDKDVANALGNFVSSVTGRGELGKAGVMGSELATILFSPRFFKSQIDTILQPYQLATERGVFANIPKSVRKEIGTKYAQYLLTNTAALVFLHQMKLTDFDPRSDAFGYLVVGERKYDITGGQRGVFALMAKLASTERKKFQTGVTANADDRFGYDKGQEIGNFLEGKMAPLTGTLYRMLTSGVNFDGKDIVPTSVDGTKNLINELFVPITLGEGINMFTQEEPARVQGIIAEFIGVSNRAQVSKPRSGDWGKLLNSDSGQYEKAVDEYNAELWKLVRKSGNSVRVKNMSKEDMADYYAKEIRKIKDDSIKDYEKYIPEEETKN
jgi:hypothetical protein